MEKKRYPVVAAILTILAILTTIGFLWAYYKNPVVYFEKGPAAVVFMLGVALVGVLIALISFMVWVWKSKGKTRAKDTSCL